MRVGGGLAASCRGSGSGGSTGMAAQLGRVAAQVRLRCWLSGCLAVWLSGCLAVSGCCLAEAGRLSGGWVAVWLGGWWLGGCGWWLAAAQGRGGTPWCYGSARETP